MDQMPEPQKGGDGQGQDDTDGKSDMSSDDKPTADAPPMEGNGMVRVKTLKVMMVMMVTLLMTRVLNQLLW